jgi:hypothetical protein
MKNAQQKKDSEGMAEIREKLARERRQGIAENPATQTEK